MYIPSILVVDDEPMISGMLEKVLRRKKYNVQIADTGKTALAAFDSREFDLVITDVYLPDYNGMEILRRVKQLDPSTGVIVITAHSSVESAVEAMKVGAYDYLTKGFSLDEIEVTVEKFFKYQRLVKENELLRSELGSKYGIENIIGISPEMHNVFEIVEMVAPSNATVLIHGASGTGKELVARALHQKSNRREQPLIKTNCAAIPEGLVESELFGHEKGAFTGAVRTTKGRFELADGGTLLLDEVSEIKPNLQAKLLRVLQEKEFEKVGNPETVQTNVRVIATTNRNLEEEIAVGNFREDLYYRLNVVPIHLPRLCERKDDIPLLAEHFIAKYAAENKREIRGIDDTALDYLIQYDWPGNVRELENTIERAVVICKYKYIQPKHLYFGSNGRKLTAGVNGSWSPDITPHPVPSGRVTLREMEKQLIMAALEENGGNRTKSAEQLGISVRTLRNKLQEYRKETPQDIDPQQ